MSAMNNLLIETADLLGVTPDELVNVKEIILERQVLLAAAGAMMKWMGGDHTAGCRERVMGRGPCDCPAGMLRDAIVFCEKAND